MLNRRALLGLLAAGASVPLMSSEALAQTRWDLSTAWPPENFHVRNAIKFAAKVKEVTNGEVEITVQPGGALGLKGPETMAALGRGVVPIADYVPIQSVGEVPLMGIGSLPFLAPTYDNLKTLDKIVRPQLDAAAAKFNHKILYVVPWQGHGIYSKDPVQSIEDLKRLKLRTSDKNGTDLFRKLGANPVQLPWSEAVTLLASGALNSMTTSSATGVDSKVWEFTKHFTRIAWMIPTDHVGVNLDAWNKLKPEHRAAIEKAAKDMEPEFWQVAMQEDKTAQEQLVARGMTIADPTPELQAEFKRVGESMWLDFEKRVGSTASDVIKQYRQASGK
jgi:TRAP-type C4-dicarboxylate transport system substrate-binding protein